MARPGMQSFSRDHLTTDLDLKNASSSQLPASVHKADLSFFSAQHSESLNRFPPAGTGGPRPRPRIFATSSSNEPNSHLLLVRPRSTRFMQEPSWSPCAAWPHVQGSCPWSLIEEERFPPASRQVLAIRRLWIMSSGPGPDDLGQVLSVMSSARPGRPRQELHDGLQLMAKTMATNGPSM